ncbi:hypothetical protein ACRZ5S_22445 (plasmid) [Vibrio scophthalmi]|uniref:hypothetical protein n=1 Tax=Vibrio scophthalmi TaxID=45658 RepID=UPI003EB9B838
MNRIKLVTMGLVLVSSPLFANTQTVMEQYQTVCGEECAQSVSRIVKTVSNQCQLSYEGVMLQSLELTGVHFVAMANSVGHPLAGELEKYALNNINCQNLNSWSTSIQDYALVLESNSGLEGQDVSTN